MGNSLRKYLYKNSSLTITTLVLIFALSFLAPYRNFLVRKVIDSTSVKELATNTTIVLAFCLGVYIFESLSNIAYSKVLKGSINHLRKDVFESIIQKNIKDFNQQNTASYISSLTNDIKIISDDYFNVFYELILYGGFIIFSIMLLGSVHLLLLLIVLLQSMVVLMYPRIIGARLQKLKGLVSNMMSDYNSKLNDFFSGFEVIKTFNIENKVFNAHKIKNEILSDSEYNSNKLNLIAQASSSFINHIFIIIIFSSSTYLLLHNKITFGLLIAATQMTIYITTPCGVISRNLLRIKSTKEVQNKLLNIINKKELKDGDIYIDKFKNKIVFENLTFSYNEHSNILNNINLTLYKGKKYAIVGSSGSGKTTLIRLLLKYYEDFSGRLLIDGIDIRDIKTEGYFKFCHTIHQNVFIFNDTMYNNICLYNDYSEEKIRIAVKKAGLEDLINKLEDGLQTFIYEDGHNLSGGEKQRIAIARALIKDPSFIAIDEATSNLDNETAYSIEESILNIQDLTALIITHKYNSSLLKKYDGIVCVKNGEIVESGSFDELINKKGYFYNLFSIQNDSFIPTHKEDLCTQN